jgi:putative lipase involved disintegration of autophagic bodies
LGTLKPGATYVYGRNGDEIYAREIGADPSTQKIIGYDHKLDPRTNDGRPLHEHIIEDKMWGEIRREARTNITLQKALDRAIMIYRLSKDNPL